MESRSWYEQEKMLERVAEESRPGTIAAGYVGNRKDRRAQAALDKRNAKRDAKKNGATTEA